MISTAEGITYGNRRDLHWLFLKNIAIALPQLERRRRFAVYDPTSDQWSVANDREGAVRSYTVPSEILYPSGERL